MSSESSALWIAVLLVAGVIAGLWYYSTQMEPAAPSQSVAPVEPREPALPPIENTGPQHPLSGLDGSQRPDLQPLPSLDDSDAFMQLELTDLFGSDLRPMLAQTNLIERIVATVDNLPRKHVAERMRPITGLSEPFVADATEADNEYVLNPDSYRRYDALVSMIATANINAVTSLYRRYYPLLQGAYTDLGYPDGYFNDRLIEVIDNLLDTPEPDRPIMLVRTHVLYQFADPGLEQLSSGQKLLLRMGPEHAATVKAKLAELRNTISAQ